MQVIQQLQIGTPPQPHPGVESNVAPLVLHPVVTSASATAAQVTVTFTPTAQLGQRVTLLLNQVTSSSPPACTFSLPPLTSSANN